MPRFDFGKGLKNIQEKLQDSAEAVKQSAKEIKVPEITESAKEAAEKAADSAKKAANETAENMKNIFKKREKKEEAEQTVESGPQVLSTESAIKIIYYMIAADGEVSEMEEQKFREMAKELDPHFSEQEERILQECRKELDKVMDDEDYFDTVRDAAEKAILSSQPTADAYITPKLLLWDLLTIAYSDDTYHDDERKLLKYLTRKLEVDKAVFLELESSMQTVRDIEKEIRWIKTTDRPYLTIEGMVNELNDRRSVIFEGIKDLITL